nr:xanthine dehydrogenase/oxidase-like [Procambarus clarkii]
MGENATSSGTLVFFVNGKKVEDSSVDPEWTLLSYLRNKLRLCGTKLGCGEGGCGACTVMISRYDRTNDKVIHYSVNACLTPVVSTHGLAVTTVEGIGSTTTGLHAVQERIARAHGSQCGFCTPGIVMSMYTLLRNTPTPSMADLNEYFTGNLCRCTGYRPILEGFRDLTSDVAGCGTAGCCKLRSTDCSSQGGSATENGETEAPALLYDTRQFRPLDPSQDIIFPPELKVRSDLDKQYLEIRGKRVVFYRPDSFAQLLRLKTLHPNAKIIVGNTEAGVEVKFKNQEYPVIINPTCVEELTSVTVTETGVVFGASITLTTLEDTLRTQVNVLPEHKTRVFSAVLEMLRWFAGKQIRNGANEYFLGYKQSRRREDDIAIVNAGFRVRFRPGSSEVTRLDLAFGGMAPTTVLALTTMKELVGKQWDPSLLEDALTLLLQDLPLPPSAPGGMVEYRRALTLSFFFKFYLSVRGRLSECLPEVAAPLTQEEQRAILTHPHVVPSSTQLFQKVRGGQNSGDPIGRPITHISALKQATGEAVYVDDMPTFTRELQAALVLSSRAHAHILAIDESEALKVDGVERFFCARDLPGKRNATGGIIFDEEVFASEKVTCVDQVVGLVVAKDKATALRAARLVKIHYQDIQPPIITIQDAIEAKSWWDPWTIRSGDLETAFSTADHVLEGEMYLGGQEHFYMETNAFIAVPKCEDGEMELFSSCQNPAKTQELVARALDVPRNRVVCRVKRIGGGFGGKETRSSVVSLPICVAAAALGRPVRIMLDRDTDMVVTGGRHPFLCRWRVAFTSQGKLLALEADLYANGGCSYDLSSSIVQRAMFFIDNAYKWEALRVTGYACRTNLPSNTAFRGFGGPQGMMFTEDVVSRVAAFLKIDAVQVREKNLYASGDTTHFTQVLERCTVGRCWREVLLQANYQSRAAEIDHFNRENKYKKRGLAVVPVKFGISLTATCLNQAGALVMVYTDGSVLLSHGGTEMGQGLHTKMVQVASRVLQLPVEEIYIAETATDKVPNAAPTAASASSDLNGMAVLEACSKIMERLKPYIDQNPEGAWRDWVNAAYVDRVSLFATGFFKTPDIVRFNFETGEGRPFSYFSYGAAATEVEVDCLTGDHAVLRTDIVMDVGESLNPAIDIGQVEGAFMQGMRLFTLEELCYSPEGVLLTRGPGMYKIPGFQDIPREFNVSLLRGAPNPRAVFSSKGVGESPLFLAASVFHGIKQALAAARADKGFDPVFRLDSPATAERIRMAVPDFLTRKIEPASPGTFKPWSVRV